jgi:hypothetical protein
MARVWRGAVRPAARGSVGTAEPADGASGARGAAGWQRDVGSTRTVDPATSTGDAAAHGAQVNRNWRTGWG